MRSIGVRNKNIVKRITNEVLRDNNGGYVLEMVRDRLPSEMWDTWESADSEINRIIRDEISAYEQRSIYDLFNRKDIKGGK